MEFTLNGTAYIVDEYDTDQWFWTSAASESSQYFPTALEAQQDAIRYEQQELWAAQEEAAQALEDENFGTYEQQVNRLYYATRL